jgi:hypothetical protein
MFFVPCFVKLRIKSKTCNILVLKCLGLVEFNIIMIMTPMSIAKTTTKGVPVHQMISLDFERIHWL